MHLVMKLEDKMSDLTDEIVAEWPDRFGIMPRKYGGRGYVYATEWNPCTLAMYTKIVHPERIPISDAAQNRMLRGRLLESLFYERLIPICRRIKAKFERTQERVSIRSEGSEGREIIVGKIDGVLTDRDSRKRIVEIKTGRIATRMRTVEDMYNDRWGKLFLAQIGTYMHATGLDGLFLLEREWQSIPHILEVNRDDKLIDEIMKDFIAKAKIISLQLRCTGSKSDESIMEELGIDSSACGSCALAASCKAFVSKSSLTPNDEMVSRLNDIAERLTHLSEAHREYEKLWKTMRQEFAGTHRLDTGTYVLTGKKCKRRTYDIPDNVKNKYLLITDYWKLELARSQADDK